MANRGTIKYDRAGNRSYFVDGVPVTEKQFLKRFPPKPIEAGLAFHTAGAWPLKSDVLAVHPKQIKAQMEKDRAAGVSTEYTGDGRPILTSRAHRKAYLKANGYHDKSGGYGD